MEKDHKILFILLYFGKLPNTFQLWLNGCEKNHNYNWMIFTDDFSKYDYPENVSVKYTTLENIKNRFEDKLGFNISLSKPYKLCDFRPLYGFFFKEYLRGYSHWGYCDTDLLFGNLSNFIDDEMLSNYSKIHMLGHLSIIKNTDYENNIYKYCDYKEILQSDQNRTFDELFYKPNFNSLLRDNGGKIKDIIPYCDIGSFHYNFWCYEYKKGNKTEKSDYPPCVFLFNNGIANQIWLENEKICCREVAYVHFQKRKINTDTNMYDNDCYLLVPNRIIPFDKENYITKDFIIKNTADNSEYYFSRLFSRMKKKLLNYKNG